MNGARFVHDLLELAGWQVEIADAQKVKGLAPLACKTDKIDAWVLGELSRRDLVPAIWLPTPTVRAERERARWRLHLVRHRTALKNRIHATAHLRTPLPGLRPVRHRRAGPRPRRRRQRRRHTQHGGRMWSPTSPTGRRPPARTPPLGVRRRIPTRP